MDPTKKIPRSNRWVTRDVYAATIGARKYTDGEYPGEITHYWTVHHGQRIPLLLNGTRYVPIVGEHATLTLITILEIAIRERQQGNFDGSKHHGHPHRKGVYVWKHERELDPISPTHWEVVLHGTDEEANLLFDSVMEEIALLRQTILTNT